MMSPDVQAQSWKVQAIGRVTLWVYVQAFKIGVGKRGNISYHVAMSMGRDVRGMGVTANILSV